MAVAFPHQQFTGIYGVSGHFDQTFCVTSEELHVCPNAGMLPKYFHIGRIWGGTFATRLAGAISQFFLRFFWGRCKSYPKKKTDHIEDNGVPS